MKTAFDTQRLLNTIPQITKGTGDFVNGYGKTEALFFGGEPYQGKNTTVFCYMGIPSGTVPQGGFPGIILVHGGGGAAFYEWVEYWNSKGYVAIAVDFSGRQYGTVTLDGAAGVGIIETNPNGRPADYGSHDETSETFYDSWIYHSVSSILLAHNILLDCDCVNPQKTVMTGISWGSVLTCITAGLDDRFAAFAPVAGGGLLQYAHWIKLQDKPATDRAEWTTLYDPASYLGNCQKPILFTMGMDDTNFSSYANSKSSELCRSMATYSNRFRLLHGHLWTDEGGMAVIERFFSSIVCDKPLPFEILSADISAGTFTVTVNHPEMLKAVFLCYTESRNEDFVDWVWHRKELQIGENGKIVCTLPENTAACFVELHDTLPNETVLSTKVFFLNG
ncbi:MAG: hypothetical protein MJ132_06140 [Clostridia bacterium]|nr:hypothetical protein [Clostridia bacterium]